MITHNMTSINCYDSLLEFTVFEASSQALLYPFSRYYKPFTSFSPISYEIILSSKDSFSVRESRNHKSYF